MRPAFNRSSARKRNLQSSELGSKIWHAQDFGECTLFRLVLEEPFTSFHPFHYGDVFGLTMEMKTTGNKNRIRGNRRRAE